MFNTLLILALILLSISIAFLTIRVIKGPSAADRIIAMDTIGINALAIMAILSILLRTRAFFDVILLFGILSFVGTIAFARYIEKGVLVEYDRNR